MPILSMSAGRVTAIWGSAYFRQQDGSLKAVRVGDDLVSGQQILTDQDGIVEIEPAVLSPKLLKLIQAANELDHTLKAMDAHDADVVPAAGLDAFGSGSLVPGIRVERIAEVVSPGGMDAALSQSTLADRLLPAASIAAAVMSAPQSESPELTNTTKTPPEPAPDGDATLPPGERGVPLLMLAVSEAGLSGHASTDAAVQTTQLDLARWPGVTGLHLVAPSTPVLAETGAPLVWLPDGHGGLLAKAGDAPASATVLTAGLDPVTGHVTVTLLAPMQHSGPGPDTLTLDLGVRSDDAALGDVAVVQVAIQDDVPVMGAETAVSVASPATNLMIMLDVSADLSQLAGNYVPNAPTPLQAAVQAAAHLLDQYEQAGQVAVRLVTFADTAKALGDQWVSVSEAKALLATLSAHGGLHYDVALPVAENAFLTEAGRLPDAQNVSYLFTAGLPPIAERFQADLGLVDASEELGWSRFLADHHIVSHAVGQGPWAHQAYLDPIAYDGHALINQDAVVVDSLVDWHAAPTDMTPFTVKGSLLNGLSMGADGFGHVQSLVVDGHTYLADLSAPEMTVHTALGGTLTVNALTGQYSYVAPSHMTGAATEAMTYTVADQDGDTVSATWHAEVHPVQADARVVPEALDLRDVLQIEHVMPSAAAQVSDHHIVLDGRAWLADQAVTAHAASAAVIGQLLTQASVHVDA